MIDISILDNPVQEYAWGSRTAIPELLGTEKNGKPRAELWMGAHPKAPSFIACQGENISLAAAIEKYPEEILGKTVCEKFGGKLPYLFKVLAAAKPLSIQAHPDRAQAEAGFARENRNHIPMQAAKRNYKDDNHKPECICALTDFWVLRGFREISDIIALMAHICPKTSGKLRDILKNRGNGAGLHGFFRELMGMKENSRTDIIRESLCSARQYSQQPEQAPEAARIFYPDIYHWLIRLHSFYPWDIGVLGPLFLHLLCLKPGQAMFLPAGELHSYLGGTGIELMANSDNVLRGGLTPKHRDLPELLRVLRFTSRTPEILSPESRSEYEEVYPSYAEEFLLSMIRIPPPVAALFQNDSAEILLCTRGKGKISGKGKEFSLQKGMSVLIPADTGRYRLSGDAVFYRAAVPAEKHRESQRY
ncbi:MAG: mannose-6-phosphate isomerase, class I, partial [Desulfococcaceae bacterium]|nr:mannose-6-phosphate isomerase, class I [Desulfococcaceae bacterium]